MAKPQEKVVTLDFSRKYNRAQSMRYFEKHDFGFRRKITTWREISISKKALKIAGNPTSVLDLPCGAGRFWKMLAKAPRAWLFAADLSEDMLEVAETYQEPEIVNRFQLFQSSAFDIKMSDNSVDNILCMRLLHHISDSENRLRILRELHRVTNDTLILSMWVDGNLQAKNRQKLENKRGKSRSINRLAISQEQAELECRDAGFKIVKHIDLLPKISMWRFIF
jgi:ubiquinone/menaquinone biosynthesis C-methylase UbiE